MTIYHLLLTLLGSFVPPFLIALLWGRLVKRYGVIGGFIAAIIVIGPMWLLNHGQEKAWIYQSGTLFFDMGFAVAIGMLAYDLASGKSIKVYGRNLSAAIVGGIIAGLLLVQILH